MKRFFILTAIFFWGTNGTPMIAGEAPEPTFDTSESSTQDDNEESKEERIDTNHFLDHFATKETPFHFNDPTDRQRILQPQPPHEETTVLFDVPKKLEEQSHPETTVREIESAPEDDFVMIKHPEDTKEKQNSIAAPTDQQNQDDIKRWKMLGKLLGKILAKLITLQLDHAILKKGSKATHINKKQYNFHLKKFKQLMHKLTIKEKEDVANIWLRSRQDAYHAEVSKLQTKLKETKQSKTLSFHAKNKLIHETNQLITAQKTRFDQERSLFRRDMQNTLTPRETFVYDPKKNLWAIKVLRIHHSS